MAEALEALHLEPLGLRTVIRSAEPRLLAAAAEAYADWRAAPSADPVITLVLEAGTAAREAASVAIEVAGQELTLAGAGVSGRADARTREAFASAPLAMADDPARLAAEVLDTLLLFLLTRAGRTPVHAAGVMAGEVALVLTGPSGTGKSTLALAAMSRGLKILSDDTLYIQLRPRLRVWGLPRPLHVFPEDAPRFTQGTRQRGGKLKAVVPLAPQAAGPAFTEQARLIVLERGDRLRLERIDPALALQRLARLEPGFDLLAQETAAAAEALVAAGAWRLTLERDPGAAIDFLLQHGAWG